jgi:hypothetical protein
MIKYDKPVHIYDCLVVMNNDVSFLMIYLAINVLNDDYVVLAIMMMIWCD